MSSKSKSHGSYSDAYDLLRQNMLNERAQELKDARITQGFYSAESTLPVDLEEEFEAERSRAPLSKKELLTSRMIRKKIDQALAVHETDSLEIDFGAEEDAMIAKIDNGQFAEEYPDENERSPYADTDPDSEIFTLTEAANSLLAEKQHEALYESLYSVPSKTAKAGHNPKRPLKKETFERHINRTTASKKRAQERKQGREWKKAA